MPRRRRNEIARTFMEQFWRIGLYIRLSKEDENENESESVINQEKILRDYVSSHFELGSKLADGYRVAYRNNDLSVRTLHLDSRVALFFRFLAARAGTLLFVVLL